MERGDDFPSLPKTKKNILNVNEASSARAGERTLSTFSVLNRPGVKIALTPSPPCSRAKSIAIGRRIDVTRRMTKT
jgi:hypothetical protein